MSDNREAFTSTTLPSLGKRVLRIGLAGNYGIDASGVSLAAERGVNFWLYSPRFKQVTPVLRELLRKDREAHVVSLLDSALLAGGPRRGIERALKLLGTDYVDCYKLGWLGRTSRFSDGIRDTLQALREEGKVRAIGCSIHDRPRAAALARESILDTFMIRYSAKHPGAEQDIFPHLAARNPTIIAYTATAWGQLLKPVSGIDKLAPWPGDHADSIPPLTGPLCYRFCLTSPHVHVVLTGPKDSRQLEQNLDALDAGPLSAEQLQWVRDYGAFVKRKHRRDYI
jgi:predicted aldo/keto reductase-like oxidoreductase